MWHCVDISAMLSKSSVHSWNVVKNMTDERVLQKQKAAQTPAVAKIQQASYQGISFNVKLYNVLVLDKGNKEVIFTAMKINLEFQSIYR